MVTRRVLVLALFAVVAGDEAASPACPMGPKWSRTATGVNPDGALMVCSNMGTCQSDGTCRCDSEYYTGDACETMFCSPVDCANNNTCAYCAVETDCPRGAARDERAARSSGLLMDGDPTPFFRRYVDTDYSCTREILGIISLPRPSKCAKKRERDCERDYPPRCACRCVECGTSGTPG